MIINKELKKIKKQYGEEMMHFCREYFPTILEKPGELTKFLNSKFAPTRSLINDLKKNDLEWDFIYFVQLNLMDMEHYPKTDLSPFELLRTVRYTLYECKTKKQVDRFKKYYKKDELLCTFGSDRIEKHHVFFAVRDDAKKLDRDSFLNPKRQDSYGTSVISIQFTKGPNNIVSIKNRYNHMVDDPDSTYSNNLENIVPGLTYSFEKYYNFKINRLAFCSDEFLEEDLEYVIGNDNKYYRYNYEMCIIFYCENNIIIDNGIVIDKYANEKERYILMDYFILDLKEKRMFLYDKEMTDSFPDTVNIGIQKIDVVNENNKKIVNIKTKNNNIIQIVLDENNNIIQYENDEVTKIDNDFLYFNLHASKIVLKNALEIKNCFLHENERLLHLELPNVIKIGNEFLQNNVLLKKIDLHNVKEIGNSFMYSNNYISTINFPNVKSVGTEFCYYNSSIKNLNFPNLEKIGIFFLCNNLKLSKITLPNLKSIPYGFLIYNKKLKYIYAPKLEEINDFCLNDSDLLKKLLKRQVKKNNKKIRCDYNE